MGFPCQFISRYLGSSYGVCVSCVRCRYAQNDSAAPSQSRRLGLCIYLSDWAPGGTAVPWASHCQSFAPTATASAHPCRRKPFSLMMITAKHGSCYCVGPAAWCRNIQPSTLLQQRSVRGRSQIREWGVARTQAHSGINTFTNLCSAQQRVYK